MTTIECTFDEFKRHAKEFNDAAPSLDLSGLDNAWKCLGLAYLGMSEDQWRHSAAAVMRIMSRVFCARELEIQALRPSAEGGA